MAEIWTQKKRVVAGVYKWVSHWATSSERRQHMTKDIFGASKTRFSSQTAHSAWALRPRTCKVSLQYEKTHKCGRRSYNWMSDDQAHRPLFGTAHDESLIGNGRTPK